MCVFILLSNSYNVKAGSIFFPSVVHCSVYSTYKGVWHIRGSLKTLEGRKEGRKEGGREEGRKGGREEGRKGGRKEGRKEGRMHFKSRTP